jgi:hypothetical protein
VGEMMYKKLNIILIVLMCLLLPINALAATYGKTGASTYFNGDVGVPTGKGYYINDVQVTSAILSDVDSIAMLDEEETITQDWTFTDYIELWKTSDATAATPCFQLRRRRDGDPTYNVSSGDGCGEITFEAYHTDAYEEAARIMGFVDGTPGDDDMPGRLGFYTTLDGTFVPALRMAIDNAGNIKMGDGVWTNYVNVTNAGLMTFEGTSSITLSDVTMSLGSDADGDIYYRASNKLVRLAKGAATNVLKMNAGATAPEWSAAGAGDVTKIGIPADSQVGVWTGDGTIEGAASLTYDGSNLQLTGDIGSTGTRITKGWFANLETTGDLTVNGTALASIYSPIAGNASLVTVGTIGTGTWEGTAIADGFIPNTITISDLQVELDAGAHSIGFTMHTATGDGTTLIDWTAGNKHKFTFGAQNETITFTNPTNPCAVQMIIVQDGTGSRTITWSGMTIKWYGGTAPTLTTTASGEDIISFIWDGTSYYGQCSKAFATP